MWALVRDLFDFDQDLFLFVTTHVASICLFRGAKWGRLSNASAVNRFDYVSLANAAPPLSGPDCNHDQSTFSSQL